MRTCAERVRCDVKESPARQAHASRRRSRMFVPFQARRAVKSLSQSCSVSNFAGDVEIYRIVQKIKQGRFQAST